MNDDKEQIRNRILEAAKKRFEHYGYNKTTVEEIAEDAGIGKGSVYLHFKSKQEILVSGVVSFNKCLLENCKNIFHYNLPIKECFNELIKTRFLTIYQYFASTPHGYEIFGAIHSMKDEIIKAAEFYIEEQKKLLINLIEKANQQGIFNVDNPKKTAHWIFMSFHFAMIANFDWFKSESEFIDYIETLVNLYYNGMLKH
ncbi:MAG: TetR/AcrR family transcriptional regulator [Spirochaetota bacterium]|nr:TetR/AcrR family transcriptional regulator [Spirochaetota bacterium]